jgi:hypothetical protein
LAEALQYLAEPAPHEEKQHNLGGKDHLIGAAKPVAAIATAGMFLRSGKRGAGKQTETGAKHNGEGASLFHENPKKTAIGQTTRAGSAKFHLPYFPAARKDRGGEQRSEHETRDFQRERRSG